MSISPILVFHILAGLTGLLSGTAAMVFRKGSRGHRRAGNVFVIAMMSMSVSALYLAIVKHQITNILAAILTLYLVSTAWLTAKRKDGETSIYDFGPLAFALAVGVTELIFGLQAVRSSTGLKYGYPAALYFSFGGVLLVAGAGDIRMLARGGVFGVQRIARHLWRMCFALFIASGSFFLGQQKVFPVSLRNPFVLSILSFLPLALMIYWLFRVRFTSTYRRRSAPGLAAVHTG